MLPMSIDESMKMSHILPVEKKQKLLDRIYHYERLGMTEAMDSAKEGITAAVLHEFGFGLIKVVDSYSSILILSQVSEEGSYSNLSTANGRKWSMTPLSKYRNEGGAVPLDYLDKLTPEIANKSVVFYQTVDPIIAYPLKLVTHIYGAIGYGAWSGKTKYGDIPSPVGSVYAGLFRWE